MADEIGRAAANIDDLLASSLLDDEARRRLTEIRDKLEEAATRGSNDATGRRRPRSKDNTARGRPPTGP